MISERLSSAFFSIFPLLPCTLDFNFVNNVLILVFLCGGFCTVSSMYWICSWIAWQKRTKSSLNLVWVGFAIAHQVCAGKVQPHWTPLVSMCAPIASSCLVPQRDDLTGDAEFIHDIELQQTCFHSPKILLPRCHDFYMFAPSRISTNFS